MPLSPYGQVRLGEEEGVEKWIRIGAEENMRGGERDKQGSKRPGAKGCIPADRQLETANTAQALAGLWQTSFLQGLRLLFFVEIW